MVASRKDKNKVERKHKWLIIPAHPDDESRAAGLLFKERKKEDEVIILVMRLCGEGNACDRPDWTREEAIAQRSAEMKEAADYLNARVLWFNPPNPSNKVICATPDVVDKMAALLREINPDRIVTHDYEGVGDHGGTTEVVKAAIGKVVWDHLVELYYFDQPGYVHPNFKPNYYVDISDPALLAACLWTRLVHRSQTASSIMKIYLERYKEHGRAIGVEYAMAYMRSEIRPCGGVVHGT